MLRAQRYVRQALRRKGVGVGGAGGVDYIFLYKGVVTFYCFITCSCHRSRLALHQELHKESGTLPT